MSHSRTQANLENFTAFRNLATPDHVGVGGIPECASVRSGTACKVDGANPLLSVRWGRHFRLLLLWRQVFAYAPAHTNRFAPTSDTPGAGWSDEVTEASCFTTFRA